MVRCAEDTAVPFEEVIRVHGYGGEINLLGFVRVGSTSTPSSLYSCQFYRPPSRSHADHREKCTGRVYSPGDKRFSKTCNLSLCWRLDVASLMLTTLRLKIV